MQSPVGGEGRPYSGRDVAKVLGLPVAAALAWQEAEAAVFPRRGRRRAASMAGLCRGACGPPGPPIEFPRTVEASTIRRVMPEQRRKFDAEFREGAVRLVRETGKPIAADRS